MLPLSLSLSLSVSLSLTFLSFCSSLFPTHCLSAARGVVDLEATPVDTTTPTEATTLVEEMDDIGAADLSLDDYERNLI